MEDKMTVKDVADLFNTYPQAIHEWDRKGFIVSSKFKNKKVFNRKDVEYFYEVHRVGKFCRDCGGEKNLVIPKNIVHFGISCDSCLRNKQKHWDKTSKSNRTTGKRKEAVDKISINRKNAVKRNQTFLCKYLSNNPCVDCGEVNIIVLEFDHIKNDKLQDVTTLALFGCSLDKLKEEISKCEVVCANCHRIRTSTRAKHYRWRYLSDTNELL